MTEQNLFTGRIEPRTPHKVEASILLVRQAITHLIHTEITVRCSLEVPEINADENSLRWGKRVKRLNSKYVRAFWNSAASVSIPAEFAYFLTILDNNSVTA